MNLERKPNYYCTKTFLKLLHSDSIGGSRCGSLLWYLGNWIVRPVRRVAEEAIPRSLKEQSSNVVRQYLLSPHMYYLTLVLYGCYFPVLVLVVASVVVATVLIRLGKLVLAMRRGIGLVAASAHWWIRVPLLPTNIQTW